MKQFSKNQKRIFMLIVGLVILTGCVSRPTEASQYYTLETTFGDAFKDGWFQGLFVFPITFLINTVIEKFGWGIIGGIGVATIVVNIVVMPIMLSSQKGSAKMQQIQPQLNKLNAKYEGRTDQNSMMMKNQEMQQLYKDNDIKMFRTLAGTFVSLPILMAMLGAVYYAGSLYNESHTFFGANLNVKPFDGFKTQPNGWLYLVIIAIMVATQFAAMKLPQYLTKKRLEADRSFKKYDKTMTAKDPMGGMTNMMIVMMVFISITTPTTMSIYYIFSSGMAVVRAFIGDQMVAKEKEKLQEGKRR